MAGVKVAGVTVTVGSVVTAAIGAPEPSWGSNLIHTQTNFGRGWDAEKGDVFTKVTFMKLQQFTGNDLLVAKIKALNPNENKGIVDWSLYQLLKDDPEIRAKVMNAPGITDEELYAMGFVSLPKLTMSTTEKSVQFGSAYIGGKISSGVETVGDSVKNAIKITNGKIKEFLKWNFTPVSWLKDVKEEDLFPQSMSEEDFREAQQDVAPGSPGARAVRDQDLRDASRRGVPRASHEND